jgi:hypothetical protein
MMMGFLSDLAGTTGARLGGEARRDAQNRERIGIDGLNNAYGQGQPHLVDARNQWDALLATGERYGNAGNALLSALGVTDPSVARSAFRASPGYDFQVERGLDAAQRRANTMGGAAGGNILAELQRLGQGYASQDWANWLGQLQGLAQTGASALGQATAGRSAASAALGGYARDYGRDASGLTMQAGQAMQNSFAQEANARTQGAANVAGLATHVGKLALGNNGLGAFLSSLPGGSGGVYAGYRTGGLY